MTVREALRAAEAQLTAAGCPDSRFDARCLGEISFGLTSTQLRLHGERLATEEALVRLNALTQRRTAGEPLQYLLGRWEFFGESFWVGKGVLIPRPETELLVRAALDFLADRDRAVVYDLCAGSGCIGLSVAKHCPGADVWLLEKSETALGYLRENTTAFALPNIHVLPADVLLLPDPALPPPDLLLSNPPYIPAGEIDSLQREVHQEPRLALDGGPDGLLFYRALADLWLPLLRPGGRISVECGEGQAEEIAALFAPVCLSVRFLRDAGGINRAVTAAR
ncbi:MAG: peptide chain release factor N(5)-glutamine methyltransferase [Oscillospiraceae bacterium]|jgi:release factor glutamine methyltransferase|nr:peptide chain release factor N(5)-glutamine methyltransferase [Oscillospiraceae bacterium]